MGRDGAGPERKGTGCRFRGTRAAVLILGLAGLPGVEALAQRGPLYTEADLLFLQHMIVHHQQAVDMAALVPDRSRRQEFVRFTGYVGRAQAAEILQMESLIDLAADRGVTVPEHALHGDPPMAGMLSTAQMKALSDATGSAFERLWLEGMIHHHQGAIDMAQAQQQHQLETRRRPYGIAQLVEDILEEQRAEIARMRGWLGEWGLTRAPR